MRVEIAAARTRGRAGTHFGRKPGAKPVDPWCYRSIRGCPDRSGAAA